MSESREYIVTQEDTGRIHISEDVVASIAAAAALEVEGVSGLSAAVGNETAHRLSMKNLKKGVRLIKGEDALRIDVSILVAYGYVIPEVAEKVQKAVRAGVENTIGRSLGNINVYVGGGTLEKPKD